MSELAENPQQQEPKTFGPFVGVLMLPLLFLAAALSIPYGLIANAWHRAREKRFAQHMAGRSRAISSSDCIQAIDSHEGTVIRERKTEFKGPTRFWWTGDDLVAKSPFPIADDSASDTTNPQFMRWCFDEYINPFNGKALFVVMTKQQRKPFIAKLRAAATVDVLTHTSEGW